VVLQGFQERGVSMEHGKRRSGRPATKERGGWLSDRGVLSQRCGHVREGGEEDENLGPIKDPPPPVCHRVHGGSTSSCVRRGRAGGRERGKDRDRDRGCGSRSKSTNKSEE